MRIFCLIFIIFYLYIKHFIFSMRLSVVSLEKKRYKSKRAETHRVHLGK
ncbi:hypothetical protein H1P_2790008 [Hyella patelloides LEGE 07179]|uniref:Uncharacterized protein n=1 Tax=Hyella patelloides LEGE 07179 TaxID=945734 RepID=A0A563VTD4_9CYAN|nr:hypothetical protein H1P_2780003 [Hyella patelloides LEGE 07179]VEP14658.1 hypothetical protein H1P_2790008 [Hyella patelloides LEGE 07179]